MEQTASYSQVTLSGDCISVLFIRENVPLAVLFNWPSKLQGG
jgi:hypothetical protein